MWLPGLFNAGADTPVVLHCCISEINLRKCIVVFQPGNSPLCHLPTWDWAILLLLLDLVWPKIGKNNCAAEIGACTTLIGAFRLSPVGSRSKSNLGRGRILRSY